MALAMGSLCLGGAISHAAEKIPSANKALNSYVLEIIRAYPTDGTHRYWWPKGGAYDGVTEDLVYQGEVVARGESEGRTYCCGLTFEVWLRACERWHEARVRKGDLRIGDLDARGLKRLRGDWYCARGGLKGPEDALVPGGFGVKVVKPEDARPGDFVQLWRKSGSGHSVVFMGWEVERGEITGMRYWSTQKSTQGIGYRTERFAGKAGLDRERLHIVRALPPLVAGR
jgi:hypothetical protein